MSRSNYTDDCDDYLALGRYRGVVRSAMRGKRGQALLIALRDALDALPEKRLIADEMVDEDGEVCALGAAGRHLHVPGIDHFDPEEHELWGKAFNVADCLVREIMYENDEGGWRETPEQRWQRMRRWVERNIAKEASA